MRHDSDVGRVDLTSYLRLLNCYTRPRISGCTVALATVDRAYQPPVLKNRTRPFKQCSKLAVHEALTLPFFRGTLPVLQTQEVTSQSREGEIASPFEITQYN